MIKKTKSKAAKKMGILHLDQQLCFPLYAASNLLTRFYRPMLDKLALTYPQYLVMLVLWEHSLQSITEIGTKLYLDSGTLTPLLKRMEKNGLVRRLRDAEDERRVLISLTKNGSNLHELALGAFAELEKSSGLPVCDVETLRQGAHKLIAILSDATKV